MTAQSSNTVQSKGVFTTTVLANESVCAAHDRVVLAVEDFPDASPGQFVQIQCADVGEQGWGGAVFIRRPFSIARLLRQGHQSELDIIYRIIGPGTQWLARRKPGDSVSILGPLGKPFEVRVDTPVAYLVGGGCGLPPLIWLAQTLYKSGKKVVAFCGARSADLLPLKVKPGFKLDANEPTQAIEEFARWHISALISTDDGSMGLTGQIPEIFDSYLKRNADEANGAGVYTCGPDAMMQAVTQICRQQGLSCQVSLERMMACGMGVCQSCVVRIRDLDDPQGWRYQLCCKDGPVFESQDVLWEE